AAHRADARPAAARARGRRRALRPGAGSGGHPLVLLGPVRGHRATPRVDRRAGGAPRGRGGARAGDRPSRGGARRDHRALGMVAARPPRGGRHLVRAALVGDGAQRGGQAPRRAAGLRYLRPGAPGRLRRRRERTLPRRAREGGLLPGGRAARVPPPRRAAQGRRGLQPAARGVDASRRRDARRRGAGGFSPPPPMRI
ncbi:MAG: hypothetical protein AVDCRST_MAG53-489, partial [uncultured Solirubrobacteraceae bacterium]